MKLVLIVAAFAMLLAPTAVAGLDTFPVCHDKDVRAAGVWVHVGVDCDRGVWVEVCKPTGGCNRYTLEDIVS